VARTIAGVTVVGVVGAGTMGAGIGQVALEAGHEVVLHDVDEAAIGRGRARIADGLRRRATKADLPPAEVETGVRDQLRRLRTATTLDAVAAEADLVLEAALEDLALKRTIFRTLDGATGAGTILATYTSALPVAAIAAATTRPERVVGLHFFNPAPLMALVEVVVPRAVDPSVVDRAEALVAAWGKTPVRTRDLPGFIVNRVNRPFTLEPLRLLETGAAGIGAVDRAIAAAGFPLGPFAYMDLVGLDVNLASTVAIWDGLGRPDRLRPSPVQEALVAAGAVGRKAGRGFYAYHDGRLEGPAHEFARGALESRLADEAVVERVRGSIAAEAERARDEGVATEDEIDLALRLGANHPNGPFEWARGRGGARARRGTDSSAGR
jgi:3-hydroxybutyryl-CoA dehydrogenase